MTKTLTWCMMLRTIGNTYNCEMMEPFKIDRGTCSTSKSSSNFPVSLRTVADDRLSSEANPIIPQDARCLALREALFHCEQEDCAFRHHGAGVYVSLSSGTGTRVSVCSEKRLSTNSVSVNPMSVRGIGAGHVWVGDHPHPFC